MRNVSVSDGCCARGDAKRLEEFGAPQGPAPATSREVAGAITSMRSPASPPGGWSIEAALKVTRSRVIFVDLTLRRVEPLAKDVIIMVKDCENGRSKL